MKLASPGKGEGHILLGSRAGGWGGADTVDKVELSSFPTRNNLSQNIFRPFIESYLHKKGTFPNENEVAEYCFVFNYSCLLYILDAADDMQGVALLFPCRVINTNTSVRRTTMTRL